MRTKKSSRTVIRVTAFWGPDCWDGDVRETLRRCRAIAAGQYGLISRSQALGAGMSRRQLEGVLRAGGWEVILPAVYCIAGVPPSREQDLLAAALWAGPEAAVSHVSAGELWELSDLRSERVDVTSARKLKSRAVVVHQSRLGEEQISRVKAIPVTDPTRTLLDLGSQVPLTHVDLLTTRFEAWARQGRNGVTAWRKLLDLRDPNTGLTDTDFEMRLFQLLRDGGLPLPVPQYVIRHDGVFVARPDFAYPRQRVAIEAESAQWHLGREAWEKDLRRRNALIALGWLVLHSWNDLIYRGDRVVEEIGNVLATRRV